MRIAVLDLGTNTFNLLIADVDDQKNYHKVHSSKEAVRLGEGGINQNTITEEAFERGLLALQNHIAKLKTFECDQVLAFGTSALRGADNGLQFVETVAEKFDLHIRIIDGDTEAEMIYNGVKLALDLGAEKSLIMDIGGGSTEFIIADQHQIFWKKSYPLGVSRLLQWLKPSDPIIRDEIFRLKNHLNENLGDLYDACAAHNIESIVGSSGSFDSLANMISIHVRNREIPDDQKSFDFETEEYYRIQEMILTSNRKERLGMRGLHRIRVDMIIAAVIMIDLVIEKCNIKKMRRSAFALKEGVLFNVLEGNL